jgi:hypothetical protein
MSLENKKRALLTLKGRGPVARKGRGHPLGVEGVACSEGCVEGGGFVGDV